MKCSPRSRCSITISDQRTSIDGTGHCNNGSEDSLVSRCLAEAAVVKKIRRNKAIVPVTVKVALAADRKPQPFKFSPKWKVPRLTFYLATELLALLNIYFLVSENDSVCEGFLVRQPVLRHLGIDSRTLLEQQRERLHEVSLENSDYSQA